MTASDGSDPPPGRRPAPDTAALRLVVGERSAESPPADSWGDRPEDEAGSALAVHLVGDGVVYALAPVTALAGVRPAGEVDRLLALLDCPRLTRVRVRMAAVPGGADARLGTIGALVTLLRWPRDGATELVEDVGLRVEAALRTAAVAADTDARRSFTLVGALARLFPADPSVLAPLLLEPLSLEVGDALLLPGGTPHAVLSGTAVRFTPAGGSVGIVGLRRGPGPLNGDRSTVLGGIQPLTATVAGPVPAKPGSLTLVATPAIASLSLAADGLPRLLGMAGAWSLIASDLVPVDPDGPAARPVESARRWWSAGRSR